MQSKVDSHCLHQRKTQIEFNSDLNPYLGKDLKPHFARQAKHQGKNFFFTLFILSDSVSTYTVEPKIDQILEYCAIAKLQLMKAASKLTF